MFQIFQVDCGTLIQHIKYHIVQIFQGNEYF